MMGGLILGKHRLSDQHIKQAAQSCLFFHPKDGEPDNCTIVHVVFLTITSYNTMK